MQLLQDIVTRVQFKLDDPDATYLTSDYVMGFVDDVYDWMFNKLSLSGSQGNEAIMIIPNVTAGSPDLSQYQQTGQPLAGLVVPSMLRWRLPGLDATFWRRADGPLDYPRDLPAGLPLLDSWAWIRYNILLSSFSQTLDIEVTGVFLFDPLTALDQQVAIAQNANRVFSCKLASDVGKARGMAATAKTYSDDADEALDDFMLLVTRARQATSERVGRISRQTAQSARLSVNR